MKDEIGAHYGPGKKGQGRLEGQHRSDPKRVITQRQEDRKDDKTGQKGPIGPPIDALFLLDDIKDIVEPESQCDPTFRTTQLYSPLTAGEVWRRLIEDKKYPLEQMPTVRTISNKLNQLGYSLKKVAKTEPKKK